MGTLHAAAPATALSRSRLPGQEIRQTSSAIEGTLPPVLASTAPDDGPTAGATPEARQRATPSLFGYLENVLSGPLFESYRFVTMTPTDQMDEIVTLRHTPGIIGRACGMVETEVTFLGFSTTWWHYPSFRKCGVVLDSKLWEFWRMAKHERAREQVQAFRSCS